ncbi:MAG: SufD family Fe-S cluster assembly protein [Peptoniphilus sp.]|nr:SufD family Fe-S cluster assembly protein [Peptoniphilus sp.]MDD7363070.1 SufD family Fe-S cluster assembly protein [Bacillota bacterium]MDY6044398.1 SufD family Fe-S cluster assembly protein [Peptoniphilus sp.]
MKAHTGNILDYKTYSYLKVNETEVEETQAKGTKKAPAAAVFKDYAYGVSPELVARHEEASTDYKRYDIEGTKDLGINELKGEGDDIVTLDFNLEEKSHLTGYFSTEKTAGYRSVLARIHVKRGAVARLYFVNMDESDVANHLAIAAVLEEGAKLDCYVFHMGDSDEISNVKCYLKGDESLGNIQSIYLGKGDQRYDFVYDLIHEGRDTTSNLLVDGALMENSYKVFKSRIDFLEGSGESRGNEEEFAILLDSSARSVSVPALLSHEDDVEGNHAASAGRIDQEMLFYFLTRGFDEKTAERMIVDAKFAPVIDAVVYEDKRETIYGELKKIMGRRDNVTK